MSEFDLAVWLILLCLHLLGCTFAWLAGWIGAVAHLMRSREQSRK